MKLVHDWRSAWKWYSTRAAAILAILPASWAALPPDLKSKVPPEWIPYILTAVSLGIIVGRIVDQDA